MAFDLRDSVVAVCVGVRFSSSIVGRFGMGISWRSRSGISQARDGMVWIGRHAFNAKGFDVWEFRIAF